MLCSTSDTWYSLVVDITPSSRDGCDQSYDDAILSIVDGLRNGQVLILTYETWERSLLGRWYNAEFWRYHCFEKRVTERWAPLFSISCNFGRNAWSYSYLHQMPGKNGRAGKRDGETGMEFYCWMADSTRFISALAPGIPDLQNNEFSFV